MNKVVIPETADCFCSNSGELTFHVAIGDKNQFEYFCTLNNIGYHEGARKDIVKSVGNVFTSNKNAFANFPKTVDILL